MDIEAIAPSLTRAVPVQLGNTSNTRSGAGEIRILYELQSFRSGAWQRVQAVEDRDLMVEAAEQVVADRNVDGARVARLTTHVDYDFVDSAIVFRQLLVPEADPLLPVPDGDHDPHWQQPSDMYRPRGREALRAIIGRYLEEQRLTPLELLHSDRHMLALDNAGTMLQELVQKVAVAQAKTSAQSSPALFKEMLVMISSVLTQLRVEAEQFPVLRLAEGRYLAVFHELEGRFSGDDQIYHLYRAIAAYLAEAKTWMEKLEWIGCLCDPAGEPRHLKWLDALLNEALTANGPYRELIDESGGRVVAIERLADLFAGRYQPPPAYGPYTGFPRINGLLVENRLPRTRATLRQRLLRELHARGHLLNGADLLAELEALTRLLRYLPEASPLLAEDEEVNLALDLRIARSITPDMVSGALAGLPKLSEKIAKLARIVAAVPVEHHRHIVGKYFRALFGPEDIVRQAVRDGGSRPGAVGPIVEVQRMLSATPIDDLTKAELLNTLDTALVDIFRSDIMTALNRPYMDRLMTLLRVCMSSPLTEGKARAFAAEMIAKELKNPRFMPAYLSRCRTDEERKEALARLRQFLASSRLGAPPRP